MGKTRPLLLAGAGVASLAIPAISSLLISTVIPTLHMDGAFQTFSSLLRLSDGMIPGKDFYPYLGSGPVFLIFPLFSIHGGSVASSVFASNFMVLLALSISFALLVTLIAKRSSFQLFMEAWLISSVGIAVLKFAIGSLAVVPQLSDFFAMSEPGNSLRPLRAFLPYLITLLILVISKVAPLVKWRLLLVAALTGSMGAIWSNDYGLVSAITALVFVTGKLFVTSRKNFVNHATQLNLGSIVFYLLSGSVVTQWNFSSLWEYNFVDVRNDQYWYFGPWDEENKINDLASLLNILVAENVVAPLTLLVLVLLGALLRKNWHWALVGYVGTSLALGGLVATIGGHAGNYFLPLKVWASFTFIIFLSRFLLFAIDKTLRAWRQKTKRVALSGKSDSEKSVARNVFLAMTLSISLFIVVNGIHSLAEKLAALEQDAEYIWHAQLGGYVDVDFVYHLSLAPSNGTKLLEEYSGLLTAVSGPRTDTTVDSVIHALGSQRQEFHRSVSSRPQTVVTSSVEIGPWVTWGLSANWWFYRDLFKHYSPIQSSPYTYVWTEAKHRAWPVVSCRVEGNVVSIDIPRPGLYEVSLNYVGPGRGSRIFSMVRNNINIASLGGDGYVALDPSANSQSFPVFVASNTKLNEGFELDLKDVGSRSSFNVTQLVSCVAREIVFPEGANTEKLYFPLLSSAVTQVK